MVKSEYNEREGLDQEKGDKDGVKQPSILFSLLMYLTLYPTKILRTHKRICFI